MKIDNLSVVIITFNEEKIIKKCIESCLLVSEDIVVIDSYSTDNTKVICERLGVNFIQHKWFGYSNQKNYGNLQAKNDWVLSIDADEILSEDFISNLYLDNFRNICFTQF